MRAARFPVWSRFQRGLFIQTLAAPLNVSPKLSLRFFSFSFFLRSILPACSKYGQKQVDALYEYVLLNFEKSKEGFFSKVMFFPGLEYKDYVNASANGDDEDIKLPTAVEARR